jgi:hypothetical protein
MLTSYAAPKSESAARTRSGWPGTEERPFVSVLCGMRAAGFATGEPEVKSTVQMTTLPGVAEIAVRFSSEATMA